MNIQRAVYYRTQHVTGPGCVLVSIRFGTAPSDGPGVVRLLSKEATQAVVSFDLEAHVNEIMEGVAQANSELNGTLEVQQIEVVPDDFPRPGQARYAAYQIARAVLLNEI